MKYLSLAAASLAAFVALPASAQETAPPKPITVSGSVALVSEPGAGTLMTVELPRR